MATARVLNYRLEYAENIETDIAANNYDQFDLIAPSWEKESDRASDSGNVTEESNMAVHPLLQHSSTVWKVLYTWGRPRDISCLFSTAIGRPA